MPDLRYDITFTGRVQGVNFRWTACRAAGKYQVSGWVRNEPDGSVRCLVEDHGPTRSATASPPLVGDSFWQQCVRVTRELLGRKQGVVRSDGTSSTHPRVTATFGTGRYVPLPGQPIDTDSPISG